MGLITSQHKLEFTEDPMHLRAKCAAPGCRWEATKSDTDEEAARTAIFSLWNQHLEEVVNKSAEEVETIRASGIQIPDGPVERETNLSDLPAILPTFLSQLFQPDTLSISLNHDHSDYKLPDVEVSISDDASFSISIDATQVPDHLLQRLGFFRSSTSELAYLLKDLRATPKNVEKVTEKVTLLLLEREGANDETPVVLTYATDSPGLKGSLVTALEGPVARVPETAAALASRANRGRMQRRRLAVAGAVVAGLVIIGLVIIGTTDDGDDDPPIATDSSQDDPGSRTIIADDSEAAIDFALALQGVDEGFEEMSRQELVDLGRQVCELLEYDTVESVTNAYATLSSADPRSISRLVVAADMYLC